MRVRLCSLAAAAVVLLTGGCHAATTTAEPARPVRAAASVTPPNGVDFLFAQMMVAHHAQAVRMSRDLIAKPGVPERVSDVAHYIEKDQQGEIDQMTAWLQAWDHPVTIPAHDGSGHGMLTEDQLAQAAAAPAPEATRLYLQQMIEHHRGAITMARSALDDGRNVFVRGVAKHIVNEQSAEIDTMQALLAAKD